jgi:hypothetical protein
MATSPPVTSLPAGRLRADWGRGIARAAVRWPATFAVRGSSTSPRRLRRYPRVMRGRVLAAASGLASCLALASPLAAHDSVTGTWRVWRTTRGVVDVAGPRSDGRFVVAARGRLFLLRPSTRRLAPYPSSGQAYAANAKLEPYIAVAGPPRSGTGSCSFPRDTVYAIEPARATGIVAVGPRGRVRRFAEVRGVKTLNGIVFDTVGRFGYHLLVVGLTADGHGALVSVDCRGRARTLTRAAPHLEGGLAVAPATFGDVAGDLIAPDEIDGRLLALAPDGSVREVTALGQAAGGDIGVESLGFVPSGGANAYLADRRAPGNANPGHDAILRLTARELRSAGVAAGDLLAALEGGAATIRVRCAKTCSVSQVATAPAGAHAEGSISFGP